MAELVWDANHTGTAVAASGAVATVGSPDGFGPTDLLGLAAAACLMRTFLHLADRDRATVLSFVASTDVDEGPHAHVRVRALVVASDAESKLRLSELLAEARRVSPVCALLGDRLIAEPDVRLVHLSTGASP